MFKPILNRIFIFLRTLIYKTKRYLYFKNFEKKHLAFSWVEGKLRITSTDHVDFIAAAQKKINKLAATVNREEFIKLALAEAFSGCNFIIFSPVGENNKFVQFWTGEHNLKYNFTANKINKLKKYYLSTIGLLSEMGFVNDTIPDYRGFNVFKIDKGKNYIFVDANFKKNIAVATTFTFIIFSQIYKIGHQKLIAKVE